MGTFFIKSDSLTDANTQFFYHTCILEFHTWFFVMRFSSTLLHIKKEIYISALIYLIIYILCIQQDLFIYLCTRIYELSYRLDGVSAFIFYNFVSDR